MFQKLSKDKEDIKKTQIELLEISTTIFEMKKKKHWIRSTADQIVWKERLVNSNIVIEIKVKHDEKKE